MSAADRDPVAAYGYGEPRLEGLELDRLERASHTIRLVRRRELREGGAWEPVGFYWVCSCGEAGELADETTTAVAGLEHADAGAGTLR